jgi:hypothetical protein
VHVQHFRRIYLFQELEAAMDTFSTPKLLGDGNLGEVYLSKLEHTPVAIKVLDPNMFKVRTFPLPNCASVS